MEWSDANVEAALRTEIIESQRSQAEILKWKLISVAALGALALSFRRAAEPEPTFWSGLDLRLLLCLVPVICAYVDLLSIHLMLRMIVIGTYLRKAKGAFPDQIIKDYESFLWDIRNDRRGNPFLFELLALHGSSFVLSALVLLFGLLMPTDKFHESYIFMVAGFSGILATFFLISNFNRRAERIAAMPVEAVCSTP